MLHNDAAQQRPDEKPASAPEASQKSIRAQGRASIKIPTRTRKSSCPGHTNAASLTDWNMETSHIIYIHGRHSPPTRLDLMTNATTLQLQQQQGSTKIYGNSPSS